MKFELKQFLGIVLEKKKKKNGIHLCNVVKKHLLYGDIQVYQNDKYIYIF